MYERQKSRNNVLVSTIKEVNINNIYDISQNFSYFEDIDDIFDNFNKISKNSYPGNFTKTDIYFPLSYSEQDIKMNMQEAYKIHLGEIEVNLGHEMGLVIYSYQLLMITDMEPANSTLTRDK